MTSSPDNTVEKILDVLIPRVGEIKGMTKEIRVSAVEKAKQSLDSHYLSIFLELVGADEKKSCVLFDDFGYHGKDCDTCFERISRDALRAELRTALQDRLGEK